MATFEAYERQFTDIVDALSRAGQSSHCLHELKRRVDDADSLIRQMDLEARSLPPADRAHLLARLRAHKLALLAAKKRAKEMAGDAGEGGAVAGQRGGGGGLRAAEERAALMEEGRDYVPLSVCASIDVCLYRYAPLSVCASIGVCLYRYVPLSVCASSGVCLYRCVPLSVCASMGVCLYR
ncbi:hypothetical protein CLOP_g12324 [Closterium sp. NIES-67]|nr:hypothetical protein CLOP_g12324 [Closterium sp. NIES-67]